MSEIGCTIPMAPASDTAATSSGLLHGYIAPQMSGTSTPASRVSGVARSVVSGGVTGAVASGCACAGAWGAGCAPSSGTVGPRAPQPLHRRARDALAVLVAKPEPLDAYLCEHPELIFDKAVEQPVLHAELPVVLKPHLAAAAQELPLTAADARWFGPAH